MLYRREEKSPASQDKTNSPYRLARINHRLIDLETSRNVEPKIRAQRTRKIPELFAARDRGLQ